MKAVVTKKFLGVPDGEYRSRWFMPGDIISGSLAVAEVATGRAKPHKGDAAAAEAKPDQEQVNQDSDAGKEAVDGDSRPRRKRAKSKPGAG